MQKILSIYCLLFIILGLFLALPCLADAPGGLLSGIPCAGTGSDYSDCSLKDFVVFFINYTKGIFGFIGSFALLLFILGGLVWLTSGGNPEKISQGKKIIVGTVIGLAIMFGAWLIVKFIQDTLLGVTPEYTLTAGFCDKKSNGTPCGDNMVCYNNYCVTKCEAKYPQGEKQCTTVPGTTSPDSTFITERKCETGLCPGNEFNLCCYPR